MYITVLSLMYSHIPILGIYSFVFKRYSCVNNYPQSRFSLTEYLGQFNRISAGIIKILFEVAFEKQTNKQKKTTLG